MNWSTRPRGQQKLPGMNKLEASYASEILQPRKVAGEIVAFWYEKLTLKLGDDCRYTPDFMVMLADGHIELHETKGFMQDDALVKLKTCAEQFPFPLVLVTRRPQKAGGGWVFRRIGDA